MNSAGVHLPGLTAGVVALVSVLVLGLTAAGCGDGDAASPAAMPTPTGLTMALPQRMPDDFGFVFRYGVLSPRNVFDTFAGTFTKDMILDSDATTDLRLSQQELEEIYRRLVDIGIEGYPADFRPPDTGSSIRSADGMELQYRFRLKTAGREFTLDWNDEYFSATPEATALRKLFEDIRAMIEARDEYQKLPPPVGGYL